ncbi:hypothetical protein [Amphibiibacter pelophylacis]|uniref:Uncharacterized protein n=1 Tax=Amphibiibacter pelophylacis TaxID=1799477 RepID=A0ACC6P2Y6_9BURK
MKKYILSFILAAAASVATAAPPSQESIEKLLTLTRSEALIDSTYVSAEKIFQQSLQKATEGRTLNAAQQRIFDGLPAKFIGVLREEVSWPKLKAQYVRIYQDTFDQDEIDGLIGFTARPQDRP